MRCLLLSWFAVSEVPCDGLHEYRDAGMREERDARSSQRDLGVSARVNARVNLGWGNWNEHSPPAIHGRSGDLDVHDTPFCQLRENVMTPCVQSLLQIQSALRTMS